MDTFVSSKELLSTALTLSTFFLFPFHLFYPEDLLAFPQFHMQPVVEKIVLMNFLDI